MVIWHFFHDNQVDSMIGPRLIPQVVLKLSRQARGPIQAGDFPWLDYCCLSCICHGYCHGLFINLNPYYKELFPPGFLILIQQIPTHSVASSCNCWRLFFQNLQIQWWFVVVQKFLMPREQQADHDVLSLLLVRWVRSMLCVVDPALEWHDGQFGKLIYCKTL